MMLKLYKKKFKMDYNDKLVFIKFLIMMTKKHKISMYKSYMIEVIK